MESNEVGAAGAALQLHQQGSSVPHENGAVHTATGARARRHNFSATANV